MFSRCFPRDDGAMIDAPDERMAMPRSTTILALLCALLTGALVREALMPMARASGDVVTRSEVERVVRALEGQAKATEDLERAVREAGRACK
jgi:hypothetical protein